MAATKQKPVVDSQEKNARKSAYDHSISPIHKGGLQEREKPMREL